jgi:hypothetical protein
LGVETGEGGSDEVEQRLGEEGRGDDDESSWCEELEGRSGRCGRSGMVDESKSVDENPSLSVLGDNLSELEVSP